MHFLIKLKNQSGVIIVVSQGKMELTIEVLTESEANDRPAGDGREDPNKNPTLIEPK